MNRKVVIIGGGISGLATAWFLEKKGFTDITILEASERAGGKVSTVFEDGFLVESAPDSFITLKPNALNLVQELGLGEQIIEPLTSRFFIYKDGKLQASPKGLSMMAVIDEAAFRDTRLFSEEGKDRILQEKNIPPRMDGSDESFASFITRRFGKEMLDNYAEPLFGGIYATPSHELSMQATFPQFLALEKKFGSLTAAAEAFAKGPQDNRSPFVSLKNGVGSLIEALVKALKHTTILTNARAESVQKTGAGYIVSAGGKSIGAEEIISALPANSTALLIKDLFPETAAILQEFTVSSSLVVTLAYREENISGDFRATGFVVAKGERSELTASTWTSQKWAGRASEGYVLIRCFLQPGTQGERDTYINKAHNSLKEILSIKGEPEKAWVHRWDNALPQYKLGHLDRVKKLEDALRSHPDFILTGAYLSGVGLPDCIRQAEQAAEKLSMLYPVQQV
jgi:protoporphyrinogen/coproporphyrinogen III oxidase